MDKPKKVLLLGSGALKIGEAGEFDYSGSQAIKALKEEGIEVILVNPNIATIQTSEHLADKVYFLPVEPFFVAKIIEKERPDAIMLSFGGQTALNCGVELSRAGLLKKHNLKVLGTQIKAIEDTEDRQLFVERLAEIEVKTPRSRAVKTVVEAIDAAKEIGYPIMTRVAFALGGRGSGAVKDEAELTEKVQQALTFASQVLIEEYLNGWKEIEYEVVRDQYDNCITVCNMENFDPMGIHTGESIVVAPSQTLTNHEYHKLREIAIKVIRHLGIVGECNIQYALSPESDDYRVIEVNARLSRSSALASKATGYPLAFIAAKLSLGYGLFEIKNHITKKTMACFEPALDYVVVKMPKWDLQKFRNVSKQIGSEMKSVGEVMAIGRKFEEALQKAIRMLQIGMYGLVCNRLNIENNIDEELSRPTDMRVLIVAEALKKGYSVDRINELSGIDKWFLDKIKAIVELGSRLKKDGISKGLLLELKKYGFSDAQISFSLDKKEEEIRNIRKQLGIKPFIKQIDTLAAEYPAETNYLFLTYNASEHDIKPIGKSIIVLGSGAYKIGSSVEFDWCCVSCVLHLRELGHNTIMINFNPETVSTDYDMCDSLYFDELSFESISEIHEYEKPDGVIVSMGGQIPNNLALKLDKAGMKLLGTSAASIDQAEDRFKFSKLLDELNVDQPEWKELTTHQDTINFASQVGYPVLVRPSYVLSGAAMSVAFSNQELSEFLTKAADLSQEHPVVISKFITDAKEIEMDAVAKNGKIVVNAITEHIENAGVHSGDATIVMPPQALFFDTIKKVHQVSEKIAAHLDINGPFNIQFLAKDNQIKVIECNLRASRSFPFVSKISKINFINAATEAMLGLPISEPGSAKSTLELDYVGCKAAQFSFSRLKGADPTSNVEMTSTGEVACIGKSLEEAFMKSLLATGFKLPKQKTVLLTVGGDKNRYKILEEARILHDNGYVIYATQHTSMFLNDNGIKNTRIFKVYEKQEPDVLSFMMNGRFGLVINVPNQYKQIALDDDYKIRRCAVDFSIPLITNLQIAKLLIRSLCTLDKDKLEIKAWQEY
jgi:carbamoyl-phosphate synthase large subunit